MDASPALPVMPPGASLIDALKADSLYGRRERLALAAGALLMVLVVAASVLIARRTGNDLSEAAAAQDVRAVTVDLLDSVISAETGQRGYLLTGRAEYLTPYNQAASRVSALLDRLSHDLPGEPDLPRWRAAIQSKMDELGQTVRLEKAGKHDEALTVVQSDRGKRDMDMARSIAGRLAAVQLATLRADLHRSQMGAQSLVLVDAVTLALLPLLGGFVTRNLRRSMTALRVSGRSLEMANAELQSGRDRLEAAVAERTYELTNANEEIQRFAYIVSHDLRAPLLNIIGFTSELENATQRLNGFVAENLEAAGIDVPQSVREASQEDLPEAIRFIQTSTAKMDRLITAILRLAREGRRVLTPERLDMKHVLSGVLDSMRHQADEAEATLVLGEVPDIVCDRIAVEQVFSNLLENALKYRASERKARIALSGRRVGSNLRYEVGDNGRGIAERDRERVFELFRRAGKQDTTGEGIGLAHVRTLLRRLGGTIECESRLGEGSTFTVLLPAVLAVNQALVLEHGAELE